MKRTGHLCEHVFSRSSLYEAFKEARRGKRKTRSCFQFERRLGFHIEELHRRLSDRTYRPENYFQFMIYEPKPRKIHAPAFRDRVVQHSIYRAIQPIFDATFIDQSFACRPGKGTHAASDYLQSVLRKVPSDSYVLQLDIRRYYYRIDRGVLRRLIEKKIKDEALVDLIMRFAETDSEKGVPIGNLLSQIFGLIYLNELDHFIKRELRVKFYARYVDDFILVGLTKYQALECEQRIISFLGRELKLELSKSSLFKVNRGVNFVGYRTWQDKRLVRKHSLYTFRESVKRGRKDSTISSIGHARRTGSVQHMLSHCEANNNGLYFELPEKVRRVHRLSA